MSIPLDDHSKGVQAPPKLPLEAMTRPIQTVKPMHSYSAPALNTTWCALAGRISGRFEKSTAARCLANRDEKLSRQEDTSPR